MLAKSDQHRCYSVMGLSGNVQKLSLAVFEI